MANPKERWDDLTEVIRTGSERAQSKLWTALPVKVMEDSDGFTVTIKSLVKGKQTDREGSQSDVEMPEMPDVPVQFTAGGGFTITHPIKKGDEGIAIFSSRCIDGWWDKGDVQPQALQRWHSLSDAMYIPGVRSKPRKLGGPPDEQANDYRVRGVQTAPKGTPASTTSVQIRSDDGKYYIELGPDGAVNIVCKTMHVQAEDRVEIATKLVNVAASDKVSMATPHLEVSGDIKAGGDIWAHAGVSGVKMSWQPVAPAGSAAAPKDIDPDAKGYWLVLTNQPDLYNDTFKVDKDFWIAATVYADGVEYCPLGSTPGLDNLPIKDGDKIVWHADTLLFEQIKGYGWSEIDGGPPPGPDPGPPPEVPWVGELLVDVSEPLAVSQQAIIPVGQVGDLFHISGAINALNPTLSHLFNGAFETKNIISPTMFSTLVTALPSQIGQIIGNPMITAPVKLAMHAHHGVRSGINKSQKPVSGT